MIDIRNATKAYGPKVAVHDLLLQVHAGELFAFLGPNAAGKTTTIKMLCGSFSVFGASASAGSTFALTATTPARSSVTSPTSHSCTRSSPAASSSSSPRTSTQCPPRTPRRKSMR